jgi:hypothetical protein
MKNVLRYTGLAGSLLLLFLVCNVFGQTGTAVKWNIPVEFVVGDKVMPAGIYITRSVWPGSNSNALMLTNRDTSHAIYILANANRNPRFDGTSMMVFLQSEEGYILSQVQDSAGVRNLAVSQSKSGNLAKSKPKNIAMKSYKQVIVKAS